MNVFPENCCSSHFVYNWNCYPSVLKNHRNVRKKVSLIQKSVNNLKPSCVPNPK